VSVGEEDHVKPAVEQVGPVEALANFHEAWKTLRMGPVELPQCNATSDNRHFTGLPGNPVSSYVTFQLLVRPFLMALQGQNNSVP
jgi:molybdopterin molybdotransferase